MLTVCDIFVSMSVNNEPVWDDSSQIVAMVHLEHLVLKFTLFADFDLLLGWFV